MHIIMYPCLYGRDCMRSLHLESYCWSLYCIYNEYKFGHIQKKMQEVQMKKGLFNPDAYVVISIMYADYMLPGPPSKDKAV